MEAKTKKIIIISSVVASLVLFAIVLIIIAATSSTCTHLDSEPIIDWSKLRNVASSNYQTLANFAGFLAYNGDESSNTTDSFVALKLRSVETRTQMGDQVMSMDLTCAKVEFHIGFANSDYTVETAKVTLSEPKLGFNVCYLDNSVSLAYNSGTHFACARRFRFDCFADITKTFGRKVLITTLVIDGIEFEVQGNPNDHKSSTYTLPAYTCS